MTILFFFSRSQVKNFDHLTNITCYCFTVATTLYQIKEISFLLWFAKFSLNSSSAFSALLCAAFFSLVNAVDYIDSVYGGETHTQHTHPVSPLSTFQVYDTVLSTTHTVCNGSQNPPSCVAEPWHPLNNFPFLPFNLPFLFWFNLFYSHVLQ